MATKPPGHERPMRVVDYFASAALSGLMTDSSTAHMGVKALCNLAYAYADCMLEAKERYESLKVGDEISTNSGIRKYR